MVHSILDRHVMRPIIINPDPMPTYILGFLSLILIIAFLFFLILTIKDSPSSGPVELTCEPGQCSTNIFTGVKDCPASTSETKTINPTIEACNSPFVCDNPKTPHALQSDGSTKVAICEKTVQCRCLQKPQCAEHVTAFFDTTLGNPYQGIDSQKFIVTQENGYLDLAGEFQTDVPLQFETPALQFCAISNEFLSRSWPKVVDEDGNFGECLTGAIAFIPENPEDFARDDTPRTPLSCVRGVPCKKGEIPFWDPRFDEIKCLK